MANEIQTTINVNVAKNGIVASLSKLIQASMSGDKIVANVQNVGTSGENIFLGEIADPQFICLVNLGAVSVDILLDGGVAGFLSPDGAGISWAFIQPFSGTTRQLAADSGTCDVLVIAAGA